MQDNTPQFTQSQFHFEQYPIEARFWAKVDKDAPNGCWLWTGAKNRGYGTISVDGKQVGTHRYSWELHRGTIPEGLQVCHNCPGGDNPACVNPDHLFLGTQKQNILDCVNKGRWIHQNPARGEKHPKNKLSEINIPVIRELSVQGVTHRELGLRFGVSHHTIGLICRREMWAWVP